jgi:predicted nucleic acid-binding protein
VLNYVLDSSFCGAFIMPDEDSQKVNQFFTVAAEDSLLHVPTLFWFEISNLLSTAIKRQRIKMDDIDKLLELLPQAKFTTDFTVGTAYSKTTALFAAKYGLTSYDASYLELAVRKGAIVGTLDTALSRACNEAGIQTIL